MKIDNREIFEQIGNAFYAIAADQHVKPLEVAELKLLISNDWIPRNTAEGEPVVSDEAHCILMTIDSLQGADASASQAFKDFEAFYRNHSALFTKELKQRINKTARDIVNVFREEDQRSNKHFEQMQKLLELREPIPFYK